MIVNLDQSLLDKRNKNIPLYSKVPNWASKLYLMTFKKNIGGEVMEVIKVGMTDFEETYDRIIYNHQVFKEGKEAKWVEDTMYGYFDEVLVNSSAMLPSGKVRELEKQILHAWGVQDLEIPNIVGMSEMRKYTKQRFAIAKNIIEKNRYVRSKKL
jgi:hypothetical protein